MKSLTQEAVDTIREFALRLPGAVEDFPWGESVAKVNKKRKSFGVDWTKSLASNWDEL